MGFYKWFLIPLSLTLTWQDWKSRQVNLIVAVATLTILGLSTHNAYQALWVFGVLWIYQYIRKNSIQFIDIALFSLGAGHFSIVFLPAYCLQTAVVLMILAKVSHQQKLPFVVAWFLGFWGTCFLELFF